MATLADIVVDCRHPASLARFWAAALDGYGVAPYDEKELARLRAAGIDDPEDDPSVLVEPGAGGPRLWFTLVPEGKVTKNRLHLDLRPTAPPAGEPGVPESGARAGEVARLVALGASVLAGHDTWTVLADPEGNEFCVLD